jgi:uncharacterized OB-fold protein
VLLDEWHAYDNVRARILAIDRDRKQMNIVRSRCESCLSMFSYYPREISMRMHRQDSTVRFHRARSMIHWHTYMAKDEERPMSDCIRDVTN